MTQNAKNNTHYKMGDAMSIDTVPHFILSISIGMSIDISISISISTSISICN